MSPMHICGLLLTATVMTQAIPAFGQADPNAAQAREEKLIAVLKSDAPHKEKADACRSLAVIGTKACVPALAGLLADEHLSHMARYALEPITDASVDECLRDALGTLKGRQLVGVIGSIGVRRDAKAVDALAELLTKGRPGPVQAAARALGCIGNETEVKALQGAVEKAPPVRQLAICEGLLRCAERLAADNRGDAAVAIYDQLRGMNRVAHQVRTAAVRGAILTRRQAGAALLKEYLANSDFTLFSAACRASREMPGTETTSALASALANLPADNQILVMQTLGLRADPTAVPALANAAKSGDKAVRLVAIRSLAKVGHASAAPVLEALTTDSDADLSKAAKESLASLPKP